MFCKLIGFSTWWNKTKVSYFIKPDQGKTNAAILYIGIEAVQSFIISVKSLVAKCSVYNKQWQKDCAKWIYILESTMGTGKVVINEFKFPIEKLRVYNDDSVAFYLLMLHQNHESPCLPYQSPCIIKSP